MRRIIGKTLRGALVLAARPAPFFARLKNRLPASEQSRHVIHVIGDSHVAMFSGKDAMVDAWPRSTRNRLDGFQAYRLGPVLAFRLADLKTSSLGREKLLATLAYGPVPPRGVVMLCFGEIDCRYHLLRQAESQGRAIDDVVAECVRRYAGVALEIQALGFSTCAWGVIPADNVRPEDANDDYPYWGTPSQRNAVARTFNRMLADQLEPLGVAVLSISQSLIGPDGQPKRDLYMDSVHLSQAALPLAVEAISASPLVPWTRRPPARRSS
ncbi:MAG: hypothetical protein WCJ13_10465 [Coriobacteriia bacterium]